MSGCGFAVLENPESQGKVGDKAKSRVNFVALFCQGKPVPPGKLLMRLFRLLVGDLQFTSIVHGKKFRSSRVFYCRKKIPGEVEQLVISGKWQTCVAALWSMQHAEVLFFLRVGSCGTFPCIII